MGIMPLYIIGRLDFAGGWSDTPPISYEQGGKVVPVAISINEKVALTESLSVRAYSPIHVMSLRVYIGLSILYANRTQRVH